MLRSLFVLGLAASAALAQPAGKTPDAVDEFFKTPRVLNLEIEIGAKEFMCIGASPPFDHPHVFLDMGDDSETICPYCSTLYRYDPSLHGYASRPPECAWREPAET